MNPFRSFVNRKRFTDADSSDSVTAQCLGIYVCSCELIVVHSLLNELVIEPTNGKIGLA